MSYISNHTPCESCTNSVKPPSASAAIVISNTRLVMRSVTPLPITFESQIVIAELQQANATLPGTMKFNEEQKAFWKTHTRPEVSSKVQKLDMLKTIAHDQEKAGLQRLAMKYICAKLPKRWQI